MIYGHSSKNSEKKYHGFVYWFPCAEEFWPLLAPYPGHRAPDGGGGGSAGGAAHPVGDADAVGAPYPGQHGPDVVGGCTAGEVAAAGGAADPGGDRKSTRLNSSHAGLSRMPSSA